MALKNNLDEDRLVQRVTSEYLRDELGWETGYAFDSETFGPNGTFGRASQHEVVLVRYLRAALEKLNPGLPATAYEQAVETLVTGSVAKSLVQLNREKYEFCKNGVPVTIRNARGEGEEMKLRVFDFDEPANNHFLAIRELYVQGAVYRRRPDIIGFVNGLPLLFIELKNIHRDIEVAYNDNLSDYKDTVPHLFAHNAFVMLSNGAECKVGSITSKYKHFNEWKRLEEEDAGLVDWQTMLNGMCRQDRFLDLFENFILFDDSKGSLVKILARNHQYLGVNRAVEAVRQRGARDGHLGVFWHTQGSGKSYSMVMFSQKVHRKLRGNFTFVIMTDRKDLDRQIYKTFVGTGAAAGTHLRAASGEHLEALLREDHRYIFSLIHKFNQDVKTAYSNRDDIIVISDEAHRTQYGRLALNMRNALPNASFIGFTGTPLFRDDEITRQIFGDYVSTYDFQHAVDDKATVPLFYDNRGEKLGITTTDLNERIAEELEKHDLDDDQEVRLEKELARDYHIITASTRLETIARDFVAHYTARWTTGKAMLICLDKITAVRMYNLIDQYWKEHTALYAKIIEAAPDEQAEQEMRAHLAWFQETEYAVVISEEQGEVQRFRAWDLDIVPHRAKMKERDLETDFKADEHPFRVAIVCAMWLTGFDVESLATLYLDKPMKAHTLMQAIARANRVSGGKENGLIVDYNGLLKHLREALATYAVGPGQDGDAPAEPPLKPLEVMLQELEEAIALVTAYLQELGFDLQTLINAAGFAQIKAIKDGVNAVNSSDVSKKKFGILARAVGNKFKAALPDPALNNYTAQYDAIDIIYKTLQKKQQAADITDILRGLQEIIDEAIEARSQSADAASGRIYDISHIDFEKLRAEFARSTYKNTAVQALRAQIESQLQRMMAVNPARRDFYARYHTIIEAYNQEKDRVTIEETFQQLLLFVEALSEEDSRAVQEGLSEDQLAVFDLLNKPTLNMRDRNKIKQVSQELLAALQREKLKIDNWREKTATVAGVKTYILDYLFKNLPEPYTDIEVQQTADALFAHVYHQYGRVLDPALEL